MPSPTKNPRRVRVAAAPHTTDDDCPEFRVCHANDRPANAHFINNEVTTSKFTMFNFIPLYLFEQFRRFANAYFLFVCVLQCIKAISITGGVPTAGLPLSMVLLFDGLVTAREDYKRHKDDAASNATESLTLRDGAFRKVQWADIRVGDLVKVLRGEEFAADMVLLSAVHEDPEQRGMCHVQTAQLDGETNLKLRKAPLCAVEALRDERDFGSFVGVIECEEPTEHFGKFTGKLRMSAREGTSKPLAASNLLLRGCVLRNVEAAYGMVVYTGNETKVRVKQTHAHPKTAAVEAQINKFIIALVMFQLVTCFVGATGFVLFTNSAWEKHAYLRLDKATFADFVIKFFTFFLLNSSFVPVSLYVTMKLARQLQKFFIVLDQDIVYRDKDMLAKTDGKVGVYRTEVRTMDLNDELGQVSHLFSDKTGTLTSNYMDLRKVTVNGVAYGLGTTQIGMARRRRLGEDVTVQQVLIDKLAASHHPTPHVKFLDGSESHPGRTLTGDQQGQSGPEQLYAIHQFMLQLVLNHTVVLETIRDKQGNVVDTQLSASSPDEEAFVYAGQQFGYNFVSRRKDIVTLDFRGQGPRDYRIVCMLPYTQMRQMMSVVVEDLSADPGDAHGRFFLFAKGADSKLLSKLERGTEGWAPEAIAARDAVIGSTDDQLREWAEDGLRTLVFAFKPLLAQTVDDFLDKYNAVLGDLAERHKKESKKPNRIDDVMAEMESGLILQGATANEDQLQEEVPETIAKLAEAGIKIYMLTGDKQETAVNIGFATHMLTTEFKQLLFTSEALESLPEVQDAMEAAEHMGLCPDGMLKEAQRLKEAKIQELVQRSLADAAAQMRDLERQGKVPDHPIGLILDEVTLDLVFRDPAASEDLIQVSNKCQTVICCRCRPDQKKMMVELVKKRTPGAHTLAVGDGANDVDMILESNVGVGIVGAEGVQAANASDYSIGRFKFLKKLLLVHGRWNYNRISVLVCYMFYKNMAFVLTQYWFQWFTGFSGQKFTIELATQAFNLLYTGAPILLLGVFDQDVSADTALAFPYLYMDGILGKRLRLPVFLWWVFSAVAESFVMFIIPYLALKVAAHPDALSGDSYSVFELGAVCFSCIIMVVNIRVALAAHFHHWVFQVFVVASCAMWVVSAFLFDLLGSDGMRGGMSRVFGSPTVWFTLPVVAFVALLHVVLRMLYTRNFRPEYRDIVQELQVMCPSKDQPLTCQQSSATWKQPLPLYDQVARNLKEWPHKMWRECVLTMMSQHGASREQVAKTREALETARRMRLVETGELTLNGASLSALATPTVRERKFQPSAKVLPMAETAETPRRLSVSSMVEVEDTGLDSPSPSESSTPPIKSAYHLVRGAGLVRFAPIQGSDISIDPASADAYAVLMSSLGRRRVSEGQLLSQSRRLGPARPPRPSSATHAPAATAGLVLSPLHGGRPPKHANFL